MITDRLSTDPDGYGFINRSALFEYLKERKLATCTEIAGLIIGRNTLRQRITSGFTNFDPSERNQPYVDFSFGYSYSSLHASLTYIRQDTTIKIGTYRKLGFHLKGVERDEVVSQLENDMTNMFPESENFKNVEWLSLDQRTKLAFFEVGFFDKITPLQMAVIKRGVDRPRCIFIESEIQRRAIENLTKIGYTDVRLSTDGKNGPSHFFRKMTSAKSINERLGLEDYAMQLGDAEFQYPGVIRYGEINNRVLFICKWINSLQDNQNIRIEKEKLTIDKETQATLIDTRKIRSMPCDINTLAPFILIIAGSQSGIAVEISEAQAEVIRMWPNGKEKFDASHNTTRHERDLLKYNFQSLVDRIKKFGWEIKTGTGKMATSRRGPIGSLRLKFPKPL